MRPPCLWAGSGQRKLAPWVVLLLVAITVQAALVPPQAAPPQPLPKELVAEWRKAGATAGWIGRNDDGWFEFQDKPTGLGGPVPAFKFNNWDEGVVSKLPWPQTAFGLDLTDSLLRDKHFKRLVQLKNLQVLNLSCTPVRDADV